LGAIVIFAVVFLLPALLGWGVKIQHNTWNRLVLPRDDLRCVYIYAHHVALSRIQKFAELDRLQVESIGALPLPHRFGTGRLVRTARGVYEQRMDLADKPQTMGLARA